MTTVPIKKNYTIYQGSVFREVFQWFQGDGVTPIDMTGYSARMQIRKTVKSTDAIETLTTDVGGGITITDEANGEFNIEIEASDTNELPSGSFVYDLEIIPGDVENTMRLLEGSITISPQVTRDD